MALMITSLGDMPLREVQSVHSSSEKFGRLNVRFATYATANKVGALNFLLNFLYVSGEEVADFLAELENWFNQLAPMNLFTVEAMEVATLVLPLAEECLSSTSAALKTIEARKLT